MSGEERIKRNSRKLTFIFISIIFFILFIFFFTPAVSKVEEANTCQEDGFYIIDFVTDLKPDRGHYLHAVINTDNPGRENYVYTTVFVSWNMLDSVKTDARRAHLRIDIDNNTNKYYLPLGTYQGWDMPGQVSEIIIELPQLQGVEIKMVSASLKKRVFFPADIYFSSLWSTSGIPVYGTINNLMIPAYVFLLLSLILTGIYYLLFRRYSGKLNGLAIKVKRAVYILLIVLMLFFSGTYIYREVLVVRSHWNAYGDDLLSGNIKETYLGIYDFERFIIWADSIIPEDQCVILFIKGEPVYIISEMAYNLYPRDIKFIDISNKTNSEITDEIESIKTASKYTYEHLIVLSEDDTWLASGYELVARYRSAGGFIYDLK